MTPPDDGFLDDWVRRALEELAAEHPLPWVDAKPEQETEPGSEGEEAA